ncbi:MAG: endonuclease [Desulfuromonas sp.]|mgnify:CR=1 FL=1|uniref:GIY-YIG nuclease family protein n=1 Tax=Desulfuromonas sp. TaxID=892 RepID=UPI000CBD5FB1|nr:GIY-YIG nuclease family protein [Desulfuromonas sp.]PLX86704.1 MAG: endonuclease [Desulfuromonas sp.]
MKPWYVYILRCADDTLYTGITNDLEMRLRTHAEGRGAKYTRGRLPVELLYREQATSRGEATRREMAIKRLPRQGKLALVGGQGG